MVGKSVLQNVVGKIETVSQSGRSEGGFRLRLRLGNAGTVMILVLLVVTATTILILLVVDFSLLL